MFVGGIVMASLAPVSMWVTAFNFLFCGGETSSGCTKNVVTGLVLTGALLGAGIPMIVIGARRDPVASARVMPWVAPHSGGLGLRFDL